MKVESHVPEIDLFTAEIALQVGTDVGKLIRTVLGSRLLMAGE